MRMRRYNQLFNSLLDSPKTVIFFGVIELALFHWLCFFSTEIIRGQTGIIAKIKRRSLSILNYQGVFQCVLLSPVTPNRIL